MKVTEAEIHYNPDLTQIINGEEVMSPTPKLKHQRTSMRLIKMLGPYIDNYEIGELFCAPFEVIFEENCIHLQPDIIFISNERASIKQDWIRGAPDLVVEIISPSSIKLDTVIKKNIYEQYGVPECWLVFPEQMKIEVFTHVSGKYQLFGAFFERDNVKSSVLPGLSFPVECVFV